MSCQEVNFALGFLCEKLGFEFSRPNSRSGFILSDSASEEAPDYSASRETRIARPGGLDKFAVPASDTRFANRFRNLISAPDSGVRFHRFWSAFSNTDSRISFRMKIKKFESSSLARKCASQNRRRPL